MHGACLGTEIRRAVVVVERGGIDDVERRVDIHGVVIRLPVEFMVGRERLPVYLSAKGVATGIEGEDGVLQFLALRGPVYL